MVREYHSSMKFTLTMTNLRLLRLKHYFSSTFGFAWLALLFHMASMNVAAPRAAPSAMILATDNRSEAFKNDVYTRRLRLKYMK